MALQRTRSRTALRSFRSVKRRLEVKAEVRGITIIDDFAHHPTAIAETLKAVRTRYPGRRLWAILEPRSNTLRRKVFQSELAQSLGLWPMRWCWRPSSSRKPFPSMSGSIPPR